MKRRLLGRTGIKVSEIGLGTWEMSGDVWGKKNDSESLKCISVAVENGVNFVDTAAGYGQGHAETLVGKFLTTSPAHRDQLVISTKVRPKSGIFAPPPEHSIAEAYPPEWIIEQCEQSLRRLGTDYIDILFIHTWSRAWGHEIAWLQTMQTLREQGKIRAIGISIPDEGVADANTQIATGQIECVQCVFNIFQQEPLYTLFPLAEQTKTGIIARSPFSSGVLAQQWYEDMQFVPGDWRGSWPKKVKPNWLADQVTMDQIVRSELEHLSVNRVNAALQFILASPAVSSVIPGSANPDHVRENCRDTDSRLPDDLMQRLTHLWKQRQLHGTYNGSI